jgi:hypothetical protein
LYADDYGTDYDDNDSDIYTSFTLSLTDFSFSHTLFRGSSGEDDSGTDDDDDNGESEQEKQKRIPEWARGALLKEALEKVGRGRGS